MMKKISPSEYESLLTYISSFFLLHQERFEFGYLYGNKFYVIKFNSDFDSIVVSGLDEEERLGFITDFGTYALSRLFDIYKPKEGYFIFNSDDNLYMTGLVKEKLFVRKISEEDLLDDTDIMN